MTTSQLSLLCLIVALFYFTNTVSGNCPEDETSPSPFYHNSSVTAPIACPIATDCKGWLEAGANRSGVYPINPDRGTPFQVYCDMETDGGGWTVFQRREDGSVDFNRNWVDYEEGFGSLIGEFWLGLKTIHRLTLGGSKTLRVDLEDFEGNTRYAQYNEFQILNSFTKYTIVFSSYTGTAGDSLRVNNLMKFSTKDQDNDEYDGVACAAHPSHSGGWWFKTCFRAFLNAFYVHGGISTTVWKGIIWDTWRGNKYSLKFTEMKVR